jgi:hypothetical protein
MNKNLPRTVVADAEFLAKQILAKQKGNQLETKPEPQQSLAEMIAQSAAKNARSNLVVHTSHTAAQDENE